MAMALILPSVGFMSIVGLWVFCLILLLLFIVKPSDLCVFPMNNKVEWSTPIQPNPIQSKAVAANRLAADINQFPGSDKIYIPICQAGDIFLFRLFFSQLPSLIEISSKAFVSAAHASSSSSSKLRSEFMATVNTNGIVSIIIIIKREIKTHKK